MHKENLQAQESKPEWDFKGHLDNSLVWKPSLPFAKTIPSRCLSWNLQVYFTGSLGSMLEYLIPLIKKYFPKISPEFSCWKVSYILSESHMFTQNNLSVTIIILYISETIIICCSLFSSSLNNLYYLNLLSEIMFFKPVVILVHFPGISAMCP